MKIMENPFEFGRELGAAELVNRIEDLALVEETIQTGGKLFVIGPRRFGKTSLLKSAAEKAADKGNLILRYNAESFPEIDGLVARIIEDSAQALQGTIERVGERIKKYFRSLRPEISFSVTQTQWKSSIGVSPSETSGQKIGLLVNALNGLEELAAEQTEGTGRVALIIDEFQEILNQTGIAAEKQIRSAIQTHRQTAYIFAGSKTRLLTEMTTDPSRPFYRLGKLLFVGVLPRTEFARFLSDKFAYGDFFFPQTGADEKRELVFHVLDLAEDVPYNVQMLAHSIWNRLLQIRIGAPEKAYLTKELVNETLEKLLRQNDPFYTQVWNDLTAIQKKALVAVVAEDGRSLQSNKVARATGIGVSSMRKSLESLAGRDILRQDEAAGEIRFRFEDPFFARWIQFFNM